MWHWNISWLGLAAAATHTTTFAISLQRSCSATDKRPHAETSISILLLYYYYIQYTVIISQPRTRNGFVYISVCVLRWRYRCAVFTRSIDRGVDVSIVITASCVYTCASLVYTILYSGYMQRRRPNTLRVSCICILLYLLYYNNISTQNSIARRLAWDGSCPVTHEHSL